MVESTAEPRGGPGRAAAPTAEELSRGREERAASYPSPFSSLREQMPFSASTHAMEGDPGANAPSPRPLPRVFPTMRENSYSRFSSSTQKLGMMIAGEAGPRSPRGEESPPSGEGIAGWCPIMPTAGVGPMGGANRNLLVKASWHQFVIFSRMPEEVIEEFLSRMRPRTFVSGQKIIHEGTVGTSLFLVDYGTVQAVMGTRVLQELASGECVGEMGLLSTIRKLKEERKDWTLNLRSCNVVAVTNCRLLELTVEKVIEVMRTAGWSATDLAKMLEPMETMEKVKRENISRHLISRMVLLNPKP
ncbi:cyclic nucleotide-binding-like protein [Baffinella frigidus]|nr:cyclic nucleotide-binding-like protein [Cryptophyta sp. CCMP2293]